MSDLEYSVRIEYIDPKTIFGFHTEMGTARVDGLEIPIRSTIGMGGSHIFIYGKDGRPGVSVNLGPLIEHLVRLHLGEGSSDAATQPEK
jgi:hypothetical protein